MGLLEQFALSGQRGQIESVSSLLTNTVDLVEQRLNRLRDRYLRRGKHVVRCRRTRSGHEVWTGYRGALLLAVHDTTTLAQVTDTECADVCSNVCIVAGNGHVGGVDRLRVDVVAIE